MSSHGEFYEHPIDFATPMIILSGGVMPTNNNNLWLMENQAYNNTPISVSDWVLINPYSNGIKAFIKGNDIVVAIRGTADFTDIKADLQILSSGLTKSSRFNNDLNIIKVIQSKYPKNRYNYYGVGNSLGGAILDELIDMGFIKEGISYNPAVDLAKFKNDTRNHRIYNEDDILYNLMGRFTKNPEVRKNKKSFFGKLASYIPLGKLGNSISAHLLSNFTGGKMKYFLSLN